MGPRRSGRSWSMVDGSVPVGPVPYESTSVLGDISPSGRGGRLAWAGAGGWVPFGVAVDGVTLGQMQISLEGMQLWTVDPKSSSRT